MPGYGEATGHQDNEQPIARGAFARLAEPLRRELKLHC
jgi:hypothetical protein